MLKRGRKGKKREGKEERKRRGITITEHGEDVDDVEEEEEPLVRKLKLKSIVVDDRPKKKQEEKELKEALHLSRYHPQPPPNTRPSSEAGSSSAHPDPVNQPEKESTNVTAQIT